MERAGTAPSPENPGAAGPGVFLGLFLVALSTLMYEILLTRIFSVTMWYHFAFMAISVAMFGMTVGAIAVYLWPGIFPPGHTKKSLALFALLFSTSTVISFLTHLSIPFVADDPSTGLVGIYSIALNYLVISVPFFFSGVCVSLALTRFPGQVGKLYGADLAGAAIGCILLVLVLGITDGPTSVIIVAAVAAGGALSFAREAGEGRLMKLALVTFAVLSVFAGINTAASRGQSSILRLIWIRGSLEQRPLYEKWNSFSRVSVKGDPSKYTTPISWGPSSLFVPLQKPVRQLLLSIDAGAETVMTAFDGSLAGVEHLQYDIINVAHFIRPGSSVFVVGAGGGRDVLSALLFQQKSVLAVEINNDIIGLVTKKFAYFTGHLEKYPQVRFVNDEARSFIARCGEKFDIIQVSFIDTWAATSAGAFVLSENSLYTVEAWKVFLERLTGRGLITFSRWYFTDSPGEMYRLTSLAAAALKSTGVKEPRGHLVIVRNIKKGTTSGVGTLLASREPFTREDVRTLEEVCRKLDFEVVLTPWACLDPNFEYLASGSDPGRLSSLLSLNLSPPTDDSPFFFYLVRMGDLFKGRLGTPGSVGFNMKAVYVLAVLLTVVSLLTFLSVIVPLMLTAKKDTLQGSMPFFVFFASIGLGFMLVEISQMQRLIIFLGHPTYGLTVILFTLLLSSGLGSFLTHGIKAGSPKAHAAVMALLLLILGIFGTLTPVITGSLREATMAVRIISAILIVFPIGIFMGMPFPLGMKAASGAAPSLSPWLWGINGATSVLASVLAIVISLTGGITFTFWMGVLCYAVAGIALYHMLGRSPSSPPPAGGQEAAAKPLPAEEAA
jgi:predicted membrane-bound spermidine synthase